MRPRRAGAARVLRVLRRDRGVVAALVAVVVTVLLTAGIPMTTSVFTATVTNTADTATAKARFLCADVSAAERRRQQAYFEYAFDEDAGTTTARDSSDAGNPGTYLGTNAKDTDTPTACPNDPGGAYRLDGSSRVVSSRSFDAALTSFSLAVWFKTDGTGKLLGYESSPDGQSGEYDRHLYIGGDGALVYGVFDGATRTLSTDDAVNDGLWHSAVGTTSPDGSVLYLDGAQVAADSSFTTAWHYTGWWRIGQGQLSGWPDTPSSDTTNSWFTGSLRFAAAYPFVLTADEVASAWSIGQPPPRSIKPGRPPVQPVQQVPAQDADELSDSSDTTATSEQAQPGGADSVDSSGE